MEGDELYQSIFEEVHRVWTCAVEEGQTELFGPPPDFLLVQECENADWTEAECLPPVLREWVYKGSTFVLRSPPGGEPVPPRVAKEAFWNYGTVRFCIAPDQARVVFTYQLGPRYGCGTLIHVRQRSGQIELESWEMWRN